MRIGIDIDNTITNVGYYLDDLNKEFGTDLTIEDLTTYKIHELVGVSFEEFNRRFPPEVFVGGQDFRKDVLEVMWELLIDGDELFIITARNSSDKMQALTNELLYGLEIPIYYTQGESKRDIAEELGIDVMIDDAPYIRRQLPYDINIILMDTPYNKNTKGCYRVTDWRGVYVVIQLMKLEGKNGI